MIRSCPISFLKAYKLTDEHFDSYASQAGGLTMIKEKKKRKEKDYLKKEFL